MASTAGNSLSIIFITRRTSAAKVYCHHSGDPAHGQDSPFLRIFSRIVIAPPRLSLRSRRRRRST